MREIKFRQKKKLTNKKRCTKNRNFLRNLEEQKETELFDWLVRQTLISVIFKEEISEPVSNVFELCCDYANTILKERNKNGK